MVKNDPHIEPRPVGCQQPAVCDGTEPVGLHGDVQKRGGDEVAADERGDGAEGLFVKIYGVLCLPVFRVAVEHEEGGAPAPAHGQPCVGRHMWETPVERPQHAAPPVADVAAVVQLPQRGDIALAAQHPVLS